MDVILLERVEKLGQIGDVVSVKNGFARNYLLPRRKALRATKQNIANFENQRSQYEVQNLERRKEADAVAAKMDGLMLIIIRQASESGQLYGSVAARDVSDGVTDAGYTIDRRQVEMPGPIKSLGIHDSRVVLHPEVMVTVRINVARSEEEAATQAAGRDAELSVAAAQETGEEGQLEEFFEGEELVAKAAAEALETEDNKAEEAAAETTDTDEGTPAEDEAKHD
tara:strand:+ start:352 stop:1026 length:675 start_codon:yes stop_codon:yes gene_type:complete